MSHLTYAQAVVTGILQGVTELFPISSLGHNVLLPALIGGQWAKDLSVSAPNSPYLAFIVGLHVATALAMIIYFWRDWLRIIRGFFSSIRYREVVTSDQRLAWMIVLATIPVGIVGAALQKVFVHVFAKPELTAFFLAVNGVILLYSERQRRARTGLPETGPEEDWDDDYYDDAPRGYSQQPQQQQWQGPGPGYGGPQSPDPEYGRPRRGQSPQQGGQPGPGQAPAQGPTFTPNPQYAQDPRYARDPRNPRYGGDPRGGDPRGGDPRRDPRDPRDPRYARDPRQDPRHGQDPRLGKDPRRARHPEPEEADRAVAADQRLSTMGFKRAVLVGSAQILALLPGISRDGIVTVTGMWRGLSREDAVRFSFLLSAPVILAAGVLKAGDLTGPLGKGIHGPVLVGSLLSFIGAYLSVRFLTRYFSEERSLRPFGFYCLIAGLLSLAYLVIH